MNHIEEFLKDVNRYCDFYLEYDATNSKYKFNNLFVDEIDFESFENDIVKLKNGLIDVLVDIEKPESFILDVLNEINRIVVWYENKNIRNFNSFNELGSLIVKTENNQIYTSSSEYTIENVQSISGISEENYDGILGYLIFHKLTTNNYIEKADFEKVKLHYALKKYFESIYNFIAFLLTLQYNINHFGIKDYNHLRPIPKPTLRCTINLSKIESANLFNLLYQSGLFYFDLKSDVKRKKAQMDFINANFNYINPRGKVVQMTNVVKEFGEINAFHHKENQLKVLDLLIDELNSIREKTSLKE